MYTHKMSTLPRIPGDKVWPLIGTAWTYFPLIGSGDDPERLHYAYHRKFLKFGEILSEQLRGRTFVSLFNPAHIAIAFKNEGKCPERVSHQILWEFRKNRPELYASSGLVPSNGEEWRHLRQAFQTEIARPQLVAKYVPSIEAITREFSQSMDTFVEASNDGIVTDVLQHVKHWALESVCVTTLDTRIDHFGPNRKPLCHQLLRAANDMLDALKLAEASFGWKYYNNSVFRQLRDNELFFYNFTKRFVDEAVAKSAEERSSGQEEPSLLVKYLQNPNHDLRNVISITADYIFTGLTTVANTTSMMLYELGRNEDKQEILYEELCRHFPDPNQPLSLKIIHQLHYVKASVKEALRLHPVSVGMGRVAPHDIELAGYTIKKGWVFLTQNQVSCRLPDYVDKPLEFLPERWLRNEETNRAAIHPYLVLPFGTGPRGCVGKSLSELQYYVLLILLLRRFRLRSKCAEITVKTKLVNVPDSSIDIQFIPRKN